MRSLFLPKNSTIFQIVVDNIPHCVIDREDSKLLVHDDKPEIIASKTCQTFNMNENDCSTLANAAKTHLNQLIVDRIQVAHRDSGIMNHNGSNPFFSYFFIVLNFANFRAPKTGRSSTKFLCK